MAFLKQLQAYLERILRAPEGLPYLPVDLAVHRRHMVAERARRSPPPNVAAQYAISRLERVFPAFVDAVAGQILDEVLPDASAEQLAELVNLAISHQIGAPLAANDRPGQNSEVKRVAGSVWESLDRFGTIDDWTTPARYAFETRVTRRHKDRIVVTQSGLTFLELPGLDAIRWLLTLESAQSIGPMDDFRIAPELAAELLERPDRHVWAHDDPDEVWPYSKASLRRVAAMRLLQYHESNDEHEYLWGYTIHERARPLLEEIAERRPTPFSVLVDALLQDERSGVVERIRPSTATRESVTVANVLQARMVVHEIRNTLVPAQIALSKLSRDLGDALRTEALLKQHARVDTGIQRALTFADEMLRVANLGAEPPTPFDLVSAVRDVVAEMAGELNGSLRFTPPEAALLAIGHRSRFAFAVLNLLRNAAQAASGKPGGLIEIGIEAQAELIAVRVDDNGPGIPNEQRRIVFDSGVALRPGGSGQGLALVRQVVEGEMAGTATCEDSPLGGARFVLRIPMKKARST
jgi:signal transduction histidine kinase